MREECVPRRIGHGGKLQDRARGSAARAGSPFDAGPADIEQKIGFHRSISSGPLFRPGILSTSARSAERNGLVFSRGPDSPAGHAACYIAHFGWGCNEEEGCPRAGARTGEERYVSYHFINDKKPKYGILLSIRTGNNQMTQADSVLTERRESHDEFPVPGGGEKLQLYAEGKQ